MTRKTINFIRQISHDAGISLIIAGLTALFTTDAIAYGAVTLVIGMISWVINIILFLLLTLSEKE